MEGCVPRILTLSLSFPTQFLSFLFLSLPLHLLSSPRSYSRPQRSSSVSSDPLFPCCQSSVAGTSRFGIRSHARRYSDLAIPSSLKLLARAHCGDLAHHRWIPACPCSCPMDPRTPVPVPAKSLHTVPVPVPAGSQHAVPVPAGSPHARVRARWIHAHCVHARWIPAHPCPCPLGPCMPCLCPYPLGPHTPVPVPDGSTHARTHSQGPHACTGSPHTLACRVPACTRLWGVHTRTHWAHAHMLALGPCTHLLAGSPCTHICVRWMHHVCIPQLYVLGGLCVVVVICSSSSTVL